jgi:hypothetical protein
MGAAELVDEVELAHGERPVEPLAHEAAQPLLVGADRARGEVLRDEPAVAAVLGRVELEEVAPHLEHVLGQVLDHRRAADLGGEGLEVAQDRLDVGVLRQRPEAAAARLGVEVDRRLALESLEDLPRLVIGEEILVEEIDAGELGHRCAHGARGYQRLHNVSTPSGPRGLPDGPRARGRGVAGEGPQGRGAPGTRGLKGEAR